MTQNEWYSQEIFDDILRMKWSHDDRFHRVFLTPEESQRQLYNLSILRRLRKVKQSEVVIIKTVIKHGEQMYRDFIEKITNQPRVDAQKFIGKKNVRQFIINRDKCCLRCGGTYKLSLDHIVPVNRKGENKIMNLQTLCCSCNSWKSNKVIDFRPGSRCLNIHRKIISLCQNA